VNTARQIATDVRNAYRQYWIALALAVTFTGLTIAYAIRGDWWAAVDELLFLAMFTVAIVNLHQRNLAEKRADEYLSRWADLDEDLDEATNRLAVERVKVDKLEAALETSERYRSEQLTELRRTRNDRDIALGRAKVYHEQIAAMPTTGADIRRMCEAFGQDVHHELHKPDGDVRALRIALLVEEMKEYLAAEQQDNIVEIADGLADVVVIAYGTACAYGIDLDAVLAEVYRSNMSKVIDGEVIYSSEGKVLKPDTYSPPAVADVIGHMDGDPWSEVAA
jgi:hypothetical protein